MSNLWPVFGLIGLVVLILILSTRPMLQPVFRWLPIPLWCYTLPMIATSLGILPRPHPIYATMTSIVLPFALGLLLLGIDLPGIVRVGRGALIATALGSVGIIVGAPCVGWIFRDWLPADAWKGLGTLAATWTGGSMNLLAMRTIIDTPPDTFTSLIIVDALITYSWMALLVAAVGAQAPLNRWLHAKPLRLRSVQSLSETAPLKFQKVIMVLCWSLILVLSAGRLSTHLPTTAVVNSAKGWVVLLVTTISLAMSCIPWVRTMNATGSRLGTPCLYVVLAAMGAQASLEGLRTAPGWLFVGIGIALVHGVVMLIGGRLLRLPFSILATASQANLGGVVSTPIVGAMYAQELAAVGLVLAVGLNAVGTYLGLCSAYLARLLLSH